MSSRHRRIQAIVRGRSLLGTESPSSRIVHALTMRGVAALEHDHQAQERARDFLISVAEGNSGLDLERLRDVRGRAWR